MRLRRSAERPARKRAIRARDGFTLLELMIVTVILGVLVALVAKPVMEMRDDAMIVATRSDLRNALRAIERFRIVHGNAWPKDLADLAEVGYRKTPDVRYCRGRRIRVRGGGRGKSGKKGTVILSAAHRGSETLVTAYFPSGRMEESELREGGCFGGGKGSPRGSGPPPGKGPPGHAGPPEGPPGRR